MYRTFTGNTQLEVTAVIARCVTNTAEAAEAIKTWIESKQAKGKTTKYILAKLEGMEKKYLIDPSIHEAFHNARALTALPRSKILPASIHYRPSPSPSRGRKPRDSDESTVRPRYSLDSSPRPLPPRSRTVSAPSPPSSTVLESPISPHSLPPRLWGDSSVSLIDPEFPRSLRPSLPRLRDVSPALSIDPESPISPSSVSSSIYPHTPMTSSPVSPLYEPYIVDFENYAFTDMNVSCSIISIPPTYLSDAQKRRESHFRRDDDFWYQPPNKSLGHHDPQDVPVA